MRGHKYFKCDCNEVHCQYCDGGLAFCTVCKGGEGSLTTECCGRPLTDEEEDRIYIERTLNFKGGRWVNEGKGLYENPIGQ